MSEDLLAGAADVLRNWPDVVLRLRQAHRAGPDGRCLGCASQVRSAPRWPCGLAVVAATASERGRRQV